MSFFKIKYPNIQTLVSSGILKPKELAFNIIHVNMTSKVANKDFYFTQFEISNDNIDYSQSGTITLKAADLTRFSCSETTCTQLLVTTETYPTITRDNSGSSSSSIPTDSSISPVSTGSLQSTSTINTTTKKDIVKQFFVFKL